MGIEQFKKSIKPHAAVAFHEGIPPECHGVIDEIMPQFYRLAFTHESQYKTINELMDIIITPWIRIFMSGTANSRTRVLIVVGDKSKRVPKYKAPTQEKRSERFFTPANGANNTPYPAGAILQGDGIFNPDTHKVEMLDVTRLMHTRGALRSDLMEKTFERTVERFREEISDDHVVFWDTTDRKPVRCLCNGEVFDVPQFNNQIGEGEQCAVWWYFVYTREFPRDNVLVRTRDTDILALFAIFLLDHNIRPKSLFHTHLQGEYIDVGEFIQSISYQFIID